MVNIAPSLVKSDWVTEDPDVLIAVALNGLSGPIKVNGETISNVPPIMPPHMFLSDQQLADTLTYVRSAWGNKADAISDDDVKKFRDANSDRFAPWTEAELREKDLPRLHRRPTAKGQIYLHREIFPCGSESMVSL
jgi:hypothetical protein